MIINSNEELNNFINNPNLTIVDFYATTCPPCKTLAKILDTINNVPIAKLNIDDNIDISEYNITAVPTLLFFKNKQIIHKMIGMQNKQNIENKIKELS